MANIMNQQTDEENGIKRFSTLFTRGDVKEFAYCDENNRVKIKRGWRKYVLDIGDTIMKQELDPYRDTHIRYYVVIKINHKTLSVRDTLNDVISKMSIGGYYVLDEDMDTHIT